jgi:hypothetical protein
MSDDPFSDVSKRRETRLQAFRDFFSGKKSKSKLGTSNGKGLGTSNGKGLGSSGGLSYGSLEETRNLNDVEEVRLSPVHEHVVDADNIVGEAEFYQARPFSDKKGQRVAGEFMPYREEHEPYGLRDDGIICISKAYLYEIHPTNDTLVRHALTPLQIGVGDQGVVYSMYKTDDHGKVKVEEAEEGEEPTPAYTLMFGEDLPDNTDYILPDEFGYGTDGEYYTPICYINNGKLEAKQFQDGRQALMRGALEGHRGPLWWIAGYDAVKNVGVGQNVYKNYTEGDDFKNLRRISQLGQERSCEGDNKVSGLPQVKVVTSGDTINIHGNRYNKTWKVGDKKQAIIEDGLVRCITDLQVENLTAVSVFAPSTTNPTVTQVAQIPTPAQKGKAYIGGDLNNTMWAGGSSASNNIVVAAVVEDDYVRGGTENVNMVQGTPHTTMWAGGATTADNVVVSASVGNDYVRGGTVNSNMIQGTPHSTMWAGGTKMTLPWVKICVSSGSGSSQTTQCYWVLGGETTPESSAPADYKFVHDPTQVTGVTSAVQITSVQDCTTTGAGVQSTVLGQGIVGTNITQVTGVTEVVKVTGVVNATTTGAGVRSVTLGQGIVGTNITQVTGIASTPSSAIAEVDVVKELTGVTVVNATNTVEVLKANDPSLRVVKESTGDGCSSCPTE